MTATQTCVCGAPLTSLVEQWTNECQTCCTPSLEAPFPKDDVMRSACASANVSALIRRMHPTDAARQAAHGYDIERELADVGPEPSDLDDDEPIACCPTCGDPLEFVTPDNDYCFNCGHVFDAAIVARVRSSSTALMCESCGAVLYGEYGPYVAPWESSCWKCGKSMVAS